MALPSTGPISLGQTNTELGRSSTAVISLGETAVRTLAGKSSGAVAMSDLRGKSSVHTVSVSPTALYAYGYGSSYASTDNATATANGGTGPFTYTWEFVSGQYTGGGQVQIGSPNSASSSFILTSWTGGSQLRTAVVRCKVVGGGQTVYSPNVTLNFQM